MNQLKFTWLPLFILAFFGLVWWVGLVTCGCWVWDHVKGVLP